MFNDQTKTHSSSISPSNDKATKLNSTSDEKLNEIFTLTNQKLQPTLDALQDKKRSISQVNADGLLAASEQQQKQTQKKSFQATHSLETDRIKTTVNDSIDLDVKSKSDEGSPNEIDNKSISAIKRSYASLPLSTSTVRNSNSCIFLKRLLKVFPTKSKSMKKSDISNLIKFTPEKNLTPKTNQQTPLDPKFNATNITSPVSFSIGSPKIEKEDLKQHEGLISGSIIDTNTQKAKNSQFSGRF